MNPRCYGQARKTIRAILPKKAQQFTLPGVRTNFIKWIQTIKEETGSWLSEARQRVGEYLMNH